MADEHVGRDEFKTWREDLKERLDGMDKRIDQKVPLDAWNLQNNHVAAGVSELDRNCRERTDDAEKTAMAAVKSVADASAKAVNDLKENKQNAWSRTLQIVAIIVAIATAYIAAKGIK